MIQFLHIFRKDVRHLWPDLTIYIGVLIAFACATPALWPGAGTAGTEPGALIGITLFLSLLRLLIPLLWLLIIVRLVQDESLVGDQQFWITRPYTRRSLLGAKLFFIAVCIALPFAAMQGYLLLHAGLHLSAAAPDLLLNLFYLALLTWLPFMAVAAVTATLPRALMSIIGAFVAFFVFALVITLHVRAQRITPPNVDETVYTLAAIAVIGILAWQYTTRRTAIARIALIATVVLVVVLPNIAPADLLFHHHYPVAANGSNLVLDPNVHPDPVQGSRLRGGPFGQALVDLPVQPWGPSISNAQALYHEVAVSYTLDAPGHHFESPWERGDLNGHNASIFVPQQFVSPFLGKPVHLHATFVAEEQMPGAPQTVTAADTFDIPGDGHCFYPANSQDAPALAPFCRYAFRDQIKTVVRRAGVPADPEGFPGETYEMRASGTLPVFDPVAQDAIHLAAGIPPGTQLSFTTYQTAGNIRVELDLPNITLDPYIAQEMGPPGRGAQRTAPGAQPQPTSPAAAPEAQP